MFTRLLTKSEKWRWLAGLVIVLLTFAAHYNGLFGEFLTYDDDTHITRNSVIRALTADNLRVMFTGQIANLYCPLTWLSFAVDYQIWGLNPFGFHLTNLLLHIANSLLVMLLIHRLLRDLTPHAALIAALTGAIFGVHPLHVESVAWATERKDVLFGFFYLLALLAYLRWVTTGRRVAFWCCFVAFIAATLSKSAAVTLPAVLLLVDVFWARRVAWLEKLPFFLVSAIVAGETVLAQTPALASTELIPLADRVGLVGYCGLFYVEKFFWPVNLSAIYPSFSRMSWSSLTGLGYALGFLAVTAGVVGLRRRAPILLPAWLFYLITLSPTIGLAPVGLHVVADYYSYIPQLGIGLAVSVGLVTAGQRLPALRPVILGATGLLLLTWTVLSARYSAAWANTETLFQSVLVQYPRCLPAHINLANWYREHQQWDAAINHSQQAVAVAPTSLPGRRNLAMALISAGRPREAVPVVREVLAENMTDPELWRALYLAFTALGNDQNAAAAKAHWEQLQPRGHSHSITAPP
ncbi:MAG: tetratricopeptide repeat protein [Verrucomicrobiota bacterium]